MCLVHVSDLFNCLIRISVCPHVFESDGLIALPVKGCHIIVHVFIVQYSIGQQYDSVNTTVHVLANV